MIGLPSLVWRYRLHKYFVAALDLIFSVSRADHEQTHKNQAALERMREMLSRGDLPSFHIVLELLIMQADGAGENSPKRARRLRRPKRSCA